MALNDLEKPESKLPSSLSPSFSYPLPVVIKYLGGPRDVTDAN